MVADLREQGFHVIAITDLHIKRFPDHGYAPFDSGIKNDVFVKNPDGSVYLDPSGREKVFSPISLSRVCGIGGVVSTKTL